MTSGAMTGGMKLRFPTVATDAADKAELRLMTESKGQAIVVLSGETYYEALESAMKIRKYVKQRNVAQLIMQQKVTIKYPNMRTPSFYRQNS